MAHKVMLAPSELAEITNLSYPILVQPKYDGFRCTYIPGTGFLSRTGKVFRNNAKLEEYFSKVFNVEDYVLDGELYIHGTPFQELASTVSKLDADIKDLKFVIYDAIHVSEWESKTCTIPYERRLKLIRRIVTSVVADFPKVLDTPTDVVSSSKDLVLIYKDYLTKGYEGVMIKTSNGLYRWKRVTVKSGELLKLKPFKSEDLVVTGVFMGQGKYEGMLGGLICDYKGIAVRVGTGFTDADRKALDGSFIGQIAEIKYLEETKDGSLRHPVFERWRDDK